MKFATSVSGTKLPIWNVRYPVAVGCRADIVGPEDVNPANSPWMWGCELIASVAGLQRSEVTRSNNVACRVADVIDLLFSPRPCERSTLLPAQAVQRM